MRIILVNKFHYRKGGAETYYLTVGEQLEKMGHTVAYFSMQHPDNLACEQDKYFVKEREYNNIKNPVRAIRDGIALIYSYDALNKFELLCDDFQPDVIHLNNVHRQITLSILDVPYMKKHHVPVVYTAHDYVTICPGYLMLDGAGNVCDACVRDGRYIHCLKKKCVKGSYAKSALAACEALFNKRHAMNSKIDRVIAPSQAMKSILIEGGWPEDKIIHLQNFVSAEIVERAAISTDGTNYSNPYILYFGRLSKEKGVNVLIEAFSRAQEKLPKNLRLVVAGDGLERNDLEKQAGDRVGFVGYKTGEELRGLISGAFFCVAPSICRENMPFSVLEAFAAGTPVIGSRIGGIPEIVISGKTGFTCTPNDAAALADSLVTTFEYCSKREHYSIMQLHCRQYVVERCDIRKYMQKLVGVYEHLICSR